SRRRHTRFSRDWSSDVCSSDLSPVPAARSDSTDSWKSPRGSYSVTVTEASTRMPSASRKGRVWARLRHIVQRTCAASSLSVKYRSEERRVGKECRKGGDASHHA